MSMAPPEWGPMPGEPVGDPPPEPVNVGKSEWDLLAEIRDLLAAILAALKAPRDTA